MATITGDIIKPAARLTPPKNWGAPATPAPAAPAAPQAPVTTAGRMTSAAGNTLGRVAGAGITTVGVGNAIGGETTADKASGVAQAAQGVLTMAKPAAGLHPGVLLASVPGMAADYLRGKMDDVPRDEITRQAQPVPPLINDIRGPATMEYAQKRLREFSPHPLMPASTPQSPNASGYQGDPSAAPKESNAAAYALLNKQISAPAQAGIQVPQLATPPAKRDLGPLPTLQAGQNQNIFSALMNLGGDMNQYRQNAAANRGAQTDFENAIKAGEFNINALSKSMNIKTQFDDNERKALDSEIKTRTAEAARILASGQYDKAQESGLRILAGMEKGKFTPAVIYGEMDPATGQQQKITVAVRDDGTVVPLQVPGQAAAGPKAVTKADFQKFVKENGYSESQARRYLESRGLKVEG